MLPNVPVNEDHARFWKEISKTHSQRLKFLKLFQFHKIKESVRVISKWVSVNESVALANLDFYIKTA